MGAVDWDAEGAAPLEAWAKGEACTVAKFSVLSLRMAILLLMIVGLAVLSLLTKVYCDARPKVESVMKQCGGSRSCSVIQV